MLAKRALVPCPYQLEGEIVLLGFIDTEQVKEQRSVSLFDMFLESEINQYKLLSGGICPQLYSQITAWMFLGMRGHSSNPQVHREENKTVRTVGNKRWCVKFKSLQLGIVPDTEQRARVFTVLVLER